MATKYVCFDINGKDIRTFSEKKRAVLEYETRSEVHGIETSKGTHVYGEQRPAKSMKPLKNTKTTAKPGKVATSEEARLEANRKQREARQKLADRKDSEIVTPKNKHCNKCDTDKKAAEFYTNRRYKDGLFPWCKDCYRAYAKDYVAKKNAA